jgi:HPt (histidine-containing phosphotransfer) domain-containing protein
LYRKLLLSFAERYTTAAADIRRLLDGKDYEKAHRLIHDIKGLAGNLSADDLQAATAELEKPVKHATVENPPEPGALAKNLDAFETLLEQALRSARSMMPPAEPEPALSGAASPPTADIVRLNAVVDEMVKYLNDYDSAATDCLDANRELFRTLFAPEEFVRFEKRLESYDFAEAQAQLERARKGHLDR